MAQDLNRVRAYFFVFIGAVGFASPFIPLFYRQQGLTGAEIGLVITLGSVVTLIASPLWGRASDSGASLTRLLQIGLVGLGLALLVLSQQSAFGWIAPVAGAQALAAAGLLPLSDTLALRVTAARRAGYGSVRVWGSAGWAVSVLASGWLIERLGLVAGFVGSAVGMAAAALLLTRVPATEAPATGRSAALTGLGDSARAVLGSRALLALALVLVVRGILGDGHQQFGNIYLQQLGASTGVIGIASMLAAVIELPSMFAADRVVRRLGPRQTLVLSFVITCARLGLVLLFPTVWAILVTRALEGISYSLFLLGSLHYVTSRVAGAQTATMLALFGVTLPALIQIFSGPFSGLVFDAVGAYWLYALALGGYLGGAGLLWRVAPADGARAAGRAGAFT